MLHLCGLWCDEGHRCVRWSPESRERIRAALPDLRAQLAAVLRPCCTHLAGHGGVKGTVRWAQSMTERLPFVARFDIRSYYESIDHRVLLDQLVQAGVSPEGCDLIRAYLDVPDRHRTGRGMVAGAALSPLLAALYLTSLDQAMEDMERRAGIRYRRFMDDFIIFAPTRHKLRAAIKRMYAVLAPLKLDVHPDKRYIGKTARGFDFLGYRFQAGRKLRPAAQSIDRLITRARRLHEQGADRNRLRQYVWRWYRWLHGGLRGRVSAKGRFTRIWIRVLQHLHNDSASPRPD
ncbi:RNA-directed DNA polymerase [uncultured Lamprocystis sp.]|uniref:RNA-directed DNA polymerase n=1 Tax=uncultured Lamprocystis sp. TaxID=543132 RepID=UPI0025E38483|nr:RNA-directed DNA polymerase [uncultured Lamprocystis sp.]